MAGGFIGQLIEAIKNGPEGMEYASMSIAGIDPTDPAGTKIVLPERTFQYWPESIQDTIEVGWQFKDIPGASHALAQWGSNGGRTFSFEVRLHRFMKPVEDRSIFDTILDPIKLTGPSQEFLKDLRRFNVDIEAEVRYLRAYCYPTYGEDMEGMKVSYPPPVALLAIPGLRMNEIGTSVVRAVMTGCDVTYNLLFPNGKPRQASVSMTFRQVVQHPSEGVLWRGIGSDGGTLNAYKFKLPDKGYATAGDANVAAGVDVPSPGGARGINDITPKDA